MGLTEQFRQNAEDALKRAREAKSMAARREWLNIAGQWTALAKARMEFMGEQSAKTTSALISKRH